MTQKTVSKSKAVAKPKAVANPKAKPKTKTQQAQALKKNMTISLAAFVVTCVTLLSCIFAFIGVNFTAVQALASGEKLYTQTDVDAALGGSGGEKEDTSNYIKVGDFIDGFYYASHIAEPNFGALDWENAIAFDDIETADGRVASGGIIWLVASFVPPTTLEQYLDEAYMSELMSGHELNAFITYVEYEDGSYQYMLMVCGSAVYVTDGDEIKSGVDGWQYDSTAVDGLRNGGEYVKYVSPQQEIWGKWISNERLVPQYGAYALKDNDYYESFYINTTPNGEAALKTWLEHTKTVELDHTEDFQIDNYTIYMLPLKECGITGAGDNDFAVIMSGLRSSVVESVSICLYSTMTFDFEGIVVTTLGFQNLGEDGLLVTHKHGYEENIRGQILFGADILVVFGSMDAVNTIFSVTPFAPYTPAQ